MIIEILNLTSIIGHYIVPKESLDNVDKNVLFNKKSEIVENKESPLKHSAGIE